LAREKYRLGKLSCGTWRRDVVATDNKSGKLRCWIGGWESDMMKGGSGDSHLPKVLGPAELAFDKNRLQHQTQLSAWYRDFRLLVVVSTND